MFITKANYIKDIHLKYTYETDKVIKFNVCDEHDKILYIAPDFSHRESTDGMLSYGYSKGAIGIHLDDNIDTDFINIINIIANKVDQSIRNDGDQYKLDVHPISIYNKDGQDKKSIWCDVIQTKDKVFTKCYDTNKDPIDIKSLNSPALIRPCLVFRVSYSKDKNIHKLRASISELCIINKVIYRNHIMAPI